MTPTFPYAGHEQGPLWWSLALALVAVSTVALMALFLVRASRAYDQPDEQQVAEPGDSRSPVGPLSVDV